jgi:uncharacterized protein
MFQYEWDPEKSKTNLKKHGLAFPEVVTVFEDDFGLTIEDDNSDEQRFITTGIDSTGRVLVVIYTFRKDLIRIISARRATAKEIQEYESGEK